MVKFEKLTVKKAIADTTRRLYTTYLNKIAVAGYETIPDLVKHAKEVLTFVKTLPAQYHKSAMNAIFYALSDLENDKKPKIYYNYFQELKQKDSKYLAHQKAEAEKE
jgi:hypothetical protein